jgi:hypothetical protein
LSGALEAEDPELHGTGAHGWGFVRLVLIESPYRAATEWELTRNLAYLRALLVDCVNRGEAPTALHGLLTQVLDDRIFAERAAGKACHIAWGRVAHAIVVGVDGGVTDGMRDGWEAHKKQGRKVETRTLSGWREAWNDHDALLAICRRDGRNYMVPHWVPSGKPK